MMRCWVATVLVTTVACTRENPDRSCSTGSCPNPAFPYCDIEGVISGGPGTCVAVTCSPGEALTCLGDDALTCNHTGNGYERVACDLGCVPEPDAHCAYIEPRYVPDACDTPADEESFVVTTSVMLDPNLDANCNGGLVPQPSAPGICVLRYRKIVIAPDAVLTVTGKAETVTADAVGRPIALVADEELSVSGILDIGAKGRVNGPGGGLVVSGGPAELVSAGVHKGGGGAGGKTAGGSGGSTSADGDGGIGGQAMADPAFLAILSGGAAAHRGNNSSVTYGGGGGGGGATLVACRGLVSIAGTIDAGGGGGSGGSALLGEALPAWGGGAGGYVVLQGKQISVSGNLFANGGGGGSGTQVNLAPGVDGANGLRSAKDAAQGSLGENGGGRGGKGGVGTQLPIDGGKPSMTGAGAGGGGGSVGFFQTYTPDGIEPTLTPAAVSPSFQPNGTIKTR